MRKNAVADSLGAARAFGCCIAWVSGVGNALPRLKVARPRRDGSGS
jgi:hypothetical protein